ncbi:MAG TPA: penicillin-binding transpeptidase domain-containing protein, partial [Myxococcaceae bacterium]|nr:penicillin-binding transpeptidase domain-containing protein [Myxococcaceae bacterium]
TYYYKIADTLGLDPIAVMGKEFGLGAPTGIEVLAENSGIMPDEAYHDRVTPGGYARGMALNSAIGQGDDNVTPLQLAMLYATIANGGKVFRPQLVLRTERYDGERLESFAPALLRTVDMPPEHHKVVVDALSAVVNEAGGTAYSQRLKDIKVAGKTGTAQVARLGSVRLKTHQMDFWLRDHAWFASFAPAENPEIAVVVLNEHGGHGGSDAAPTAMAVIKKYFELKQADAAPPQALAATEASGAPDVRPVPGPSSGRPAGEPAPPPAPELPSGEAPAAGASPAGTADPAGFVGTP